MNIAFISYPYRQQILKMCKFATFSYDKCVILPKNNTNDVFMTEIRRDITDKLRTWKESPRRKPLVLQGARQVGKSWALKKFGKEYFEDTVYINFDTMPAIKEDFKRTKEPQKLIKMMEMMTGKAISPASTLIIMDEIQECNEALNCLKYFCEDAPEYAVVCAGSLLGVALNRSGASFPVGKVDFMTLYPVSFAEYLRASDAQLYQTYQMIDEVMTIPEVTHQQMTDAYKLYLVLGGMPEAVSVYLDTRSWEEVKTVQDAILQSYALDFSKHINNKDIPRIFQVWGNLQDQLAREDKKFRYGDVQKGGRAREYEGAIEWLCLAGLVHRVSAVETPRIPLSAYKKSNAFKLYINDVGLLGRKFDMDAQTILTGDRLFTEFKGVMAENYVLQALVRQYGQQHYYWVSGNTAEVEFILQDKGRIIPIEVKAQKNVTAKSLSCYRKQYTPQLSMRLSTLNMRNDDDLLCLPLYLADKIKMFVETLE